MTRSVLVVTVVHHPSDARIYHRQIRALARGGWNVTYAAPFTAHGRAVPTPSPRLRGVDLPRATGRRRGEAFQAARAVVRRLAPEHDLVLLHDPELLVATAGLGLGNLVWDVHEDTGAALTAKAWVPPGGQLVGRAAVRQAELQAERRMPLLLAEHAYQERFRRTHPVVPNTTWAPATVKPPAARTVVYLGTVTMARGAAVLAEAGALLRDRADGELTLEVIGPAADRGAEVLLERAAADGALVWRGFVDNARALPLLSGALVGLSLLHDLPNYRHSMPTKVLEYMAHGVPVVTTPLPVPARLVADSGSGLVVPFGDPDAVVEAVLRLRDDLRSAARMGAAGHRTVREHYDWTVLGGQFVATMEQFARAAESCQVSARQEPVVRAAG